MASDKGPSTPKHDAVVLYSPGKVVPDHEAVVHRDIAMRIADLMDVPYDGYYDEARHAGKHCYFIPSDTILTPAQRDRLGIRGEQDIFGGYANHAFMPTKAISHGLVRENAGHPQGWSAEFSKQVADATLHGYTAFSFDDVHIGAQRLLAEGPLRLKPVHATAGRGQVLLRDEKGLDAALEGLDTTLLGECGVVLETHLENVTTYSVGQVRLPHLTASYIGTQRLTRDNRGEWVYGGSRLRFCRGNYDVLLGLPLGEGLRAAITMAQRYDAAADACYPGFFASRRNYDVAGGTDIRGRPAMGVLEQSWRIGGASRAEIAALEVLSADPSCHCLWAETLEIFNVDEVAPAHAVETYAGQDPELGPIRKYVMVEAYGNK
ncbi:MAG: DUF3182 family protein [Burkholderiaceae bacterium]